MRKLIKYGMLLIIAALLITGCTTNKPNGPDFSEQSIVIYTSVANEQSFYQSYGNNILRSFPGLDIQLHMNEDGREINVEALNQIQPDLLFLYYPDFIKLQEEEYLLPIEANDAKHGLDQTRYADIMINMLSDYSGTLYGLAPNVYLDGLFFNKQLFDHYHVDYLTDGMSWEELFATVQLLSDSSAANTGYEAAGVTAANMLLNTVAQTNQITLINEDDQVVIEGTEWQQAIEQVVSFYQHATIGTSSGTLFKNGEAAILYNNVYAVNELNSLEFDWGMVSMPTHPTNRDYNNSIILDQAIALPKTTSNADLSYQIMGVLMSEEVSDTYSSGLKLHTISTLKSKRNQYQGVDISNLWEQQTYPPSYYVIPSDIEQNKIEQIYQVVNHHLTLAIEEQLTIAECISQLKEQLTMIVQL